MAIAVDTLHHFDSCMREDCNREGELLPGVDCILIYACARIATLSFRFFLRPHLISIHACARIAIGYWTHLGLGVAYFNSCMCEDCNERIRLAGAGNANILIHACARIATKQRSRRAELEQIF